MTSLLILKESVEMTLLALFMIFLVFCIVSAINAIGTHFAAIIAEAEYPDYG